MLHGVLSMGLSIHAHTIDSQSHSKHRLRQLSEVCAASGESVQISEEDVLPGGRSYTRAVALIEVLESLCKVIPEGGLADVVSSNHGQGVV